MGNTAAVSPSLDALVAEAGQALEDARRLFGPSPADGVWSTTPTLSGGRGAVAQAVESAGLQWQGSGAETYFDAGGGQVKALDSAIGADNRTAPGLTATVRTASNGGEAMDGVISDTRAGVAAIAPSTGTPAGRAELVTHLQGQLDRARALLRLTAQRNAELAAMIRNASAGYGTSPMGMSPMMGAPTGMSGGGGVGGSLGGPGLARIAALIRSRNAYPPTGGDTILPHQYALRGGGPAAQMAVKAALSKLGRPYVWGAKGPDAFDCSGLVRWSYAQAGITLGADSYTMYRQGAPVAPGDVQAGDAIFPHSSFSSTGPGHVMLAISPTECIEAQQSGVPVKISPMPGSFVARRVAP
ncbi:MAG: C40 family peptidase [Mycobacterium sp.]